MGQSSMRTHAAVARKRSDGIRRSAAALLAAGVAGQGAFEVVGLLIAPALLGAPLKPAALVAALSGSLAGVEISMTWAWSLHLFAGTVVFPLGYVIIRRISSDGSWMSVGVVWGVLLWLVAQAILAPLAGRPFMLGFTPYTWGSLAAHVIYALTVALTFERMSRMLSAAEAIDHTSRGQAQQT